jgi:hypothetical protein
MAFLKSLKTFRHFSSKLKAVFSLLKEKRLSFQDLLTANFSYKKSVFPSALISVILILSLSNNCFSSEVLAGEDYKTDVVVLNEELRKVNDNIQKIYPIGSIYINASVDTNPATLLGFGTWEVFGAGRVLIGINSADADFDTAEETGGAKTVDISHNHGGYTGVGSSGTGAYTGAEVTYGKNHVHSIASGGSSTQSIVQPYIVVYMWKRIS